MPLTDLTNRNYPTKSSSLSTWEECDDVLQRQRRSTNTFNVKVPAKQHPSGKRTNAKNTGGRTTVKLTDVFPSKTASVAEKEEEEDFFASSGKDEAVIIVATKGTYSLRHHQKKL
jgi:DNA-directed RNA polymerase alpha subunit